MLPARKPLVDSMRVFLHTLGCPKNEVDSEKMASLLVGNGHTTVADPADADAIIVNTCGFVESAKSSRDLELFEFSHQGLKEALVDAVSRGVRVRLILDPKVDLNLATATFLKEHGARPKEEPRRTATPTPAVDKAALLAKLEERFILGEISEDAYRELKRKYESAPEKGKKEGPDWVEDK